ncbi:MAG TPA: ABC transporter permease subunit, partial [Kiloniellaceae bacterium]|nr:ABC transporter permease subunit [Kiloniellaceae bacterium]
MTTEATVLPQGEAAQGLWQRLSAGRLLPVVVIVSAIVLIWYLAAIELNAPWQIDTFARANQDWSARDLVLGTWDQERPLLPAPHQVLQELYQSVFEIRLTSKRNLLYHAWVTTSSTLLGFLFGTLLGILLAVGVVHVKTLDRSLLPWVIASQTIPILAIAPMIIVVLGAIGLKGLIPKAIISTYLCFFPVTIG